MVMLVLCPLFDFYTQFLTYNFNFFMPSNLFMCNFKDVRVLNIFLMLVCVKLLEKFHCFMLSMIVALAQHWLQQWLWKQNKNIREENWELRVNVSRKWRSEIFVALSLTTHCSDPHYKNFPSHSLIFRLYACSSITYFFMMTIISLLSSLTS